MAYAELLLFPDSTRGLSWWPKLKYALCLFMQCSYRFNARWSDSEQERKVLEQEFARSRPYHGMKLG